MSAHPSRGSPDGASSDVLLLHGQPGSARDWDAVIERLDALRAIACDRPGWGGGAATGLEGNVRAAVASLDRGGVERAILVGHSFGAAVAAAVAVAQPERVAGLVLVAPAANCASLVWIDRVLAAPVVGDALGAVVLGAAATALTAAPVRRTLEVGLGVPSLYLERTRHTLRAPSAWRAFSIEQRALVRELPVLEERLGEIRAPTSILAGASDRIVPLSSARRLSEQIPRARLVVVPRADHLLALRRPGAVAEAILELAGSVGAGAWGRPGRRGS